MCIYIAATKLPEKMPPMLLLPSFNYAEVDCENATYAADTHINTLLLPTAISLLLYRYFHTEGVSPLKISARVHYA